MHREGETPWLKIYLRWYIWLLSIVVRFGDASEQRESEVTYKHKSRVHLEYTTPKHAVAILNSDAIK